jgi:hypothetical protein
VDAPEAMMDFRLRAQAVAIDKGVSERAIGEDIVGGQRPFDGDHNGTAECDQGAFEFVE